MEEPLAVESGAVLSVGPLYTVCHNTVSRERSARSLGIDRMYEK